jgi:glycosyltransferase involved in cell wall biosynthesis
MSPAPKRSRRGIRYVAQYDSGGYGTAARRNLIGLRNADVPFTWTPMISGFGWHLGYQPFTGRYIGDPDLDPFCNLPIDYDTVIVHMVPEYLIRWRSREPDRLLVAHTVWETDRLPHHWMVSLEQADHILVPCTWNKTVFERRGLTAGVSIFPHIAVAPEPTQCAPIPDIPDDHFVFYSIEVWSARKALWNTLAAYLDTFTKSDPVTLVLKTSDYTERRQGLFSGFGRTRDAVDRILRRYHRPARVKLLTDHLSRQDISRLHARGNCYVSLSRGEGWSLGAFDAAAYGKPVITTGFGGQTDYLPCDSAYFVDYRLIPVKDELGKPSFTEDQNWAEPSITHASALMREAVSNRADATRRGAELRTRVLARFTEQAVISDLLDTLDAL